MIDPASSSLSFLPLKFSRNKLAHTIEAADVTLANRANLKYFLTLCVPEFPFSTIYEDLHTSEGRETPVSTEGGVQVFGGAEFRYNSGRNGKIDGLLTYLKPTWKQNTLSLSLSQTMSFYLREGIQGGTPTVGVSNDLPKAWAIKAGLSNEDFLAYQDTFFNTWQPAKRQFLTWQPNYKTVSPTQEEYLFYLFNFSPSPTEVRLRVHYLYPDGSASDAVTKMTLANPLMCSVGCCPVGPQAMGVPAGASGYEVWLSDEKNFRFTETRIFKVDRNYQVADRAILFVNSLGGWDTLRLTGEGARSLKVQQTVAEIERTATAGSDFSELKIVTIEGEYELQVSTGYFRRDASSYLQYLDELLLSDEMYLMTEKGHRPVQLTSNTLIDQQDNADLIARNFTFRILDTIENFSSLPAGTPVQARATHWRGLKLKQVLDGFGKRTGKLIFERLEKVYSDDNSLVKPYTVKSNVQGDPDFIAAITDSSIAVGSTPYPSAVISRTGSFKRTTCGAGQLGGPSTIVIAAGRYGAETAGAADRLAEAEFASLDTQAYADANGSCAVNNVPVHFSITHRIPMGVDFKVIGGGNQYGPVVDLRISSEEIIPNCVGDNPATTRLSEKTYAPGTYNFIMEVEYVNQPFRACKLRIAAKNREVVVNGPGYYAFENVIVTSADEPLAFEIVNV